MKIQQINNDELAINESGVGTLVLGIIFIIIGIGVAVSPLVTTSVPWWVSLIGIAIAGLFVWVMFSAKSRHVVLRRAGISEIVDTKILGGKTARSQFEANQVVSVGLETRTEYNNNAGPSSMNDTSGRTRVSILYVLLNDNSEVVLATKRNSNNVAVGGVSLGSFGAAPLSKEAKQIADFFGVQVKAQNHGEPSLQDIKDTVGAIRDGIMGTSDDAATPQAPVVTATPEQTSPSPQPSNPSPSQTPPAPAPTQPNNLK